MGMKRAIGQVQKPALGMFSPGLQAYEAPRAANETTSRFEFWRGASGRRYIHTIHPLRFCPPVADATYMLVSREGDRRRVLAVGRTHSDAASLNLAEIRQAAARLGANEVHVHLIAASERDRAVVEFDLKAKLLDAAPSSFAN